MCFVCVVCVMCFVCVCVIVWGLLLLLLLLLILLLPIPRHRYISNFARKAYLANLAHVRILLLRIVLAACCRLT